MPTRWQSLTTRPPNRALVQIILPTLHLLQHHPNQTHQHLKYPERRPVQEILSHNTATGQRQAL